MTWSLPTILDALHDDIERRLARARKTIGHPGAKGDASEEIWLSLLQTYLPARYRASAAYVVDSKGAFSDQIDIAIYDQQYTPLMLQIEGIRVIPAESVYAIFEAKQTIDAGLVEYAKKKVASVRRLHRTSLPIPTAAGMQKPKDLHPILGGIVAIDSSWNPRFGAPLTDALLGGTERLDLGCVASYGYFSLVDREYSFRTGKRPTAAFLFELIARLQEIATVPMIDLRNYGEWLEK